MVAAAGAMNSGVVRLGDKKVALVRLADAAGMRRRSGSRERQRNKISDKRDEQQKSGCQALHAFRGM
jgi:acid phosphatase family membrane protein YuiD